MGLDAKIEGYLLSPLPGLVLFHVANPRLAPWATLCHHSVAP